ncbi:MAG TPA: uracil-DNA glycosylase family protein [Spirochaetota bacterium]|nr:uracil-DNA glycosylase family protein [Spirochaetota bacterium]HPI89651.1 uracil-DNA glycosylase family protein [Spirochaetota bacterium]HPR49763.1 uracil-DNA glycosylase family protein [Spirochaetota bacterium]
MSSSIRDDIAAIMKKKGRRVPLLYRGDEERAYIAQWISRDLKSFPSPEIEQSIEQTILACSRCGSVAERKIGYGSGANRVMIILNSPGLISSVEKKVYRTESVALLKKMVHAIGLKFNECYVTNLIKCEVSDSLVQPSEIVSNCGHILRREIDFYRPEIVIVLGDLSPLHKIIKQSRGISWHNTEHPITLLKNPDLKRKAWETLKVVMEKLGER